MRRVVVTGMGIASPLGSTVETAFERLKTYQNCIEYWAELDEIKLRADAKIRKKKLAAFHQKLAGLAFLEIKTRYLIQRNAA